MDWYFKCFRYYFTFSGRARRKEYWMFQLVHGVVLLLLIVGDEILSQEEGGPFLAPIYMLATLIPMLAVKIRRLHDVDWSGWWCLLPIIPFGSIFSLYLMVKRGDEGFNQYGADPRDG